MKSENDTEIRYTEKHDELLKRVFGKEMTFETLKRMCEGKEDFYPEDDLLPYVVGTKGSGDDEHLADDIIWLLNEEY